MRLLTKALILTAAIVLLISVPVAQAGDAASQKIIVEDLLQTMKVDQMTKPLFEQMRSMMEQQFAQMGASEDMKPILKKYRNKLFDIMEQAMNWQSMKEDIINIYLQTYTETELKGMLAFYKSEVGQSVISKTPLIMKQSMLVMQKRLPELQERSKRVFEEMSEEVNAEMKKKAKNQGEKTQ